MSMWIFIYNEYYVSHSIYLSLIKNIKVSVTKQKSRSRLSTTWNIIWNSECNDFLVGFIFHIFNVLAKGNY